MLSIYFIIGAVDKPLWCFGLTIQCIQDIPLSVLGKRAREQNPRDIKIQVSAILGRFSKGILVESEACRVKTRTKKIRSLWITMVMIKMIKN